VVWTSLRGSSGSWWPTPAPAPMLDGALSYQQPLAVLLAPRAA
jgi:hypothetical protein